MAELPLLDRVMTCSSRPVRWSKDCVELVVATRSAARKLVTVRLVVNELLAVFGSVSVVEPTEAEKVNTPVLVGWTVNCRFVTAPTARVPRLKMKLLLTI